MYIKINVSFFLEKKLKVLYNLDSNKVKRVIKMILRRPYAILIKSFRLIHLIMFLLLAYVTYKANNILNFFKDYIAANGNIEVIAANYINALIFVSITLIIILSLTIYLLMRYKKKPKLLYLIVTIVMVLSVVSFLYLYSQIYSLEISSISGREVRLLRDISRFTFWGLFLTCIPILIRALGFDIKKFNFSKDLNELKLEKEDSEEVEVNIDLTPEDVKTFGRKKLRELKYYYAENKFFINIIISVIVIILILVFPFNKFVINRTLNEKEVLATNYFNIKVNKSYITERKRTSLDSAYLIIDFSIKGKAEKYNLNLDNFVLETKNNKYIPSLKYYYYFSDLEIPGYRKQELNTKEYKNYLLIYNIKKEDENQKFKLDYIVSERKIKLSPMKLD